MTYKQWDIVKVPGFLLGLPDGSPDQFGVIISSDTLLKAAERYWILQVPNPVPETLLDGDIEVPSLRAVVPPEKFIVRTHTIFAVHEMDLEEAAISHLPGKFRRPVMKYVNTFLPRGGLGIPGM